MEGTHLLAEDGDDADQLVILEHGDNQGRPDTPKFNGRNNSWVAIHSVGLLQCIIDHVDRRFGRNQTTERRSRTGTEW